MKSGYRNEIERDNEMASKFTKGPWVAGWGDGLTGPRMANMTGWDALFPVHVMDGEYGTPVVALSMKDTSHIANANLIAAAPDMYEAMSEFVRRVDAGEVRSIKTYNSFKAILAKADGETQ